MLVAVHTNDRKYIFKNIICIILYDMHCTINISSLPNVVEHMTTAWTEAFVQKHH